MARHSTTQNNLDAAAERPARELSGISQNNGTFDVYSAVSGGNDEKSAVFRGRQAAIAVHSATASKARRRLGLSVRR
jgi:hypothetical protein